MKRYFSAQVAKPGLVLSAIAVLFGSCWVITYLQALNANTPPSAFLIV